MIGLKGQNWLTFLPDVSIRPEMEWFLFRMIWWGEEKAGSFPMDFERENWKVMGSVCWVCNYSTVSVAWIFLKVYPLLIIQGLDVQGHPEANDLRETARATRTEPREDPSPAEATLSANAKAYEDDLRNFR